MIQFRILAVNISEKKAELKRPVPQIRLVENWGIENDAHAGDWHRQVSLLAQEDIDTIKARGLEIQFGDFAENITTEGIELHLLPIGARIQIGEAILEVTQIGKECHHGCAVFQQIGDCVMPRRGIFARVIRGGVISHESPGSYDI